MSVRTWGSKLARVAIQLVLLGLLVALVILLPRERFPYALNLLIDGLATFAGILILVAPAMWHRRDSDPT